MFSGIASKVAISTFTYQKYPRLAIASMDLVSPCASMAFVLPCAPPSRPARRVTFAEDTKAHDGLLPLHALYDTLVVHCLTIQGMASCEELVAFVRARGHSGILTSVLNFLNTKVCDLGMRLRGGDGACTVLETGGGSNAKIPKAALKCIDHLQLVLIHTLLRRDLHGYGATCGGTSVVDTSVLDTSVVSSSVVDMVDDADDIGENVAENVAPTPAQRSNRPARIVCRNTGEEELRSPVASPSIFVSSS
jgi:hypothetical protein